MEHWREVPSVEVCTIPLQNHCEFLPGRINHCIRLIVNCKYVESLSGSDPGGAWGGVRGGRTHDRLSWVIFVAQTHIVIKKRMQYNSAKDWHKRKKRGCSFSLGITGHSAKRVLFCALLILFTCFNTSAKYGHRPREERWVGLHNALGSNGRYIQYVFVLPR